MVKRALVPGGGGPGLGGILGVLDVLADHGMTDSFKVISASCIGAWVAVVYYSREDTQAERATYDWFKPVFQPADVHSSWPVNRIFAADYRGNAKAHLQYLTDPKTLRDAFVPAEMFNVGIDTLKYMMSPGKWLDESTTNILIASWMGAHPVTRLLAGLQYRTAQNGMFRIFYEDAPLLRELHIHNLYKPDRPEIRFNAVNLSLPTPAGVLFTNRIDQYGMIDARTLCACSALPSIFSPIEIKGDIHCEGATVDTVQFINLLEDHPDLDEVWIIRIVGLNQAAPPRDATEALANSFMIPAASIGELNIEAFRAKAKALNWQGRIIEIPVPKLKWEWSIPNLELGHRLGTEAARAVVEEYEKAA